MKIKVKFCGIRREEDVRFMNEFKPDYAGYIFAESKRRVTPEQAAALSLLLDKAIKRVGVFVNETTENIAQTALIAGLDVIQLHGDEGEKEIQAVKRLLPGVEIWKAVRVHSPQAVMEAQALPCKRLLLDSFSPEARGGTGKLIDIELLKSAGLRGGFFLAGGINAGNMIRIVREMRPYGVDISSGIETDGVKDRTKIQEIMRCLECLEKEDSVSSAANMSPKP